MIRSIIFDMDGTLADTSPGIFASYRHLAETIGKEIPSDEKLKSVLGGPLPSNIAILYNLNENEIQNCVDIYRKYYSEYGWKLSMPYDGLKETLIALNSKNVSISIATMKAESFAEKMIKNWGFDKYFSFIIGVDDTDQITKSEMIDKIVRLTEISKKETIMVGDTIHDYQSAVESNINFIATTYGFQLTTKYCEDNNIAYIDDIKKITDFIEDQYCPR